MSYWHRFHLGETVKAVAVSDTHRFFVHVREPPGENRRPVEFYRWTLRDAQEAADQVVQAYYPHDCEGERCGAWRKADD